MDELEKALEFQARIDILVERISKFIPEAKEHLAIKNCILMAHNTLEGIINLLLSRYYLGEEMEKTDKDKVNNFWINLLGETSFIKKLQIIKEAAILDKDAIKALSKINTIRNDIAHYSQRIYKRKDRYLMYNGKYIFKDLQALKMFCGDFDTVLQKALKRIKEK